MSDIELILAIGATLSIETPQLYNNRFVSHLRGLERKKYLIVDRPILSGIPMRLEKDAECIIRFIHQGRAYGFTSYVLFDLVNQFSLAFLTFPKYIETTNLRKHDRYPILVSGQISAALEEETQILDVELIDLSGEGCLISCSQRFPRDSAVYLNVTLPKVGPVANLKCEVKSCSNGNSGYLAGLYFLPEQEQLGQVDGYLQVIASLNVRPFSAEAAIL